jgi:opacity protein-like surface antigen
MSWKLSLALVCALAWLPASSVRAADEPASEETAESAAPAEPEAPAEKEAKTETAEADESEESEEADEDEDAESAYDRDGWYLGLGAGWAKELFQNGNSADSGFIQARAGYHYLRFAATEVQLEYTPKFKGKSGKWAGTNIATWAAWLNIKGYPTAPWTGPVQPFGMIGLAWMWERLTGPAVNGSIEEGGFAARFGAGIDFYVTRNIVLNTEAAYVLPTGKLDDLDQVQLGGNFIYRF